MEPLIDTVPLYFMPYNTRHTVQLTQLFQGLKVALGMLAEDADLLAPSVRLLLGSRALPYALEGWAAGCMPSTCKQCLSDTVHCSALHVLARAFSFRYSWNAVRASEAGVSPSIPLRSLFDFIVPSPVLIPL